MVRRETKVNLWFLVIFLVISLPGAVILFRKKLDPSASRMDQPDQVVRALPYMMPPPTPPGMRWIVPPATQQWLAQLAGERTGSAKMVSALGEGPEWEPVISKDHLLQVVTEGRQSDSIRFGLLVWVGKLPIDPRAYVGTVKPGEGNRRYPLTMTSVESLPVPPTVRHELVSLGFDHPPVEVTWLAARTQEFLFAGDQTITLSCPSANPPLSSSVSYHVPLDRSLTRPISNDPR